MRVRTRKNFAKVQWLLRYREWIGMANDFWNQAREIEERVFGTGSPRYTGLPGGGSVSDGKDLTVMYLENFEALRKLANEYAGFAHVRLHEIEDAIEKLDDPDERTVLRHRYISGHEWDMIAGIMCYDRSTVLRAHGKALEKLEIPTDKN